MKCDINICELHCVTRRHWDWTQPMQIYYRIVRMKRVYFSCCTWDEGMLDYFRKRYRERKRRIEGRKRVQLRLAIEYPVAVSYCMLASCYSDTQLDALLSSLWLHIVSVHQQINLWNINNSYHKIIYICIAKENTKNKSEILKFRMQTSHESWR